MSFLNSMRMLQDNLLRLTEPANFGVSTNRLTVRTRTWAGTRVGCEGGSYTAQTGDTWASIANRFYRSPTFAMDLRTLNHAGTDPTVGAAYTYPAYFDQDLVLAQRYEFEHVTEREVAGSGGRYQMGDLKVLNASPEYFDEQGKQVGGYTPAQLKPAGAPGKEIIYVVTGPDAGDYQLRALHTEDAFQYLLVIGHTRRTP